MACWWMARKHTHKHTYIQYTHMYKTHQLNSYEIKNQNQKRTLKHTEWIFHASRFQTRGYFGFHRITKKPYCSNFIINRNWKIVWYKWCLFLFRDWLQIVRILVRFFLSFCYQICWFAASMCLFKRELHKQYALGGNHCNHLSGIIWCTKLKLSLMSVLEFINPRQRHVILNIHHFFFFFSFWISPNHSKPK